MPPSTEQYSGHSCSGLALSLPSPPVPILPDLDYCWGGRVRSLSRGAFFLSSIRSGQVSHGEDHLGRPPHSPTHLRAVGGPDSQMTQWTTSLLCPELSLPGHKDEAALAPCPLWLFSSRTARVCLQFLCVLPALLMPATPPHPTPWDALGSGSTRCLLSPAILPLDSQRGAVTRKRISILFLQPLSQSTGIHKRPSDHWSQISKHSGNCQNF